jgi:hypothetical protein
MKQVIAVQNVWYAGSERQPGCEPFEMSDTDAHILGAHDLPGGPKVKLADAKPVVAAKAPVETKVMEASPPAEKADKPESLFTQQGETTEPEKPPKRTYKRRDMVAED